MIDYIERKDATNSNIRQPHKTTTSIPTTTVCVFHPLFLGMTTSGNILLRGSTTSASSSEQGSLVMNMAHSIASCYNKQDESIPSEAPCVAIFKPLLPSHNNNNYILQMTKKCFHCHVTLWNLLTATGLL